MKQLIFWYWFRDNITKEETPKNKPHVSSDYLGDIGELVRYNGKSCTILDWVAEEVTYDDNIDESCWR